MSSRTRFLFPVVGLALALAGSGSLMISSTRAQTRPAPTAEQAHQAAVTAQVALAAFQLDAAGLHDLDTQTNAGSIPAGALGKVRKARIVVAVTQWPDAMKEQAAQFVEHALKVETALAAENAAMAAPDATEVHEIGHSLATAAYDWMTTLVGAAPATEDHPH